MALCMAPGSSCSASISSWEADSRSIVEHDEGTNGFAVVRVGRAGARRLFDGGMGEQDLINLARVDVVAADDHHVLFAIADIKIPVGVQFADVTGI